MTGDHVLPLTMNGQSLGLWTEWTFLSLRTIGSVHTCNLIASAFNLIVGITSIGLRNSNDAVVKNQRLADDADFVVWH